MLSQPFVSAKDGLFLLFDENRKKVLNLIFKFLINLIQFSNFDFFTLYVKVFHFPCTSFQQDLCGVT